jgi:hypothetical protein
MEKIMLKLFTIDKFIFYVYGVILFVGTAAFVEIFPFSIPNKIAISLCFGLLAYGIYGYYFGDNEISIQITLRKGYKYSSYPFLLFYLFSLLMVILPTPSSSLLYLSWGNLPLLELLKLFSSILLTSFLPGYALVNFINKKAKADFLPAGKIVLSILMSLTLTSFITFLYWLFIGNFQSLFYVLYFMFALIFLVLIAQEFLSRKHSNEQGVHSVVVNHAFLSKIIILFSIIAIITWVFLSTHLITQTLGISGDELSHLGLVIQLSKGWQSWQAAQSGSGIYPYFFHLDILASASLSNLPFLNVFESFFFILILPALAFYYMAQMVFRTEGKNAPLIATVLFSTCAGFGWIYACFARGVMPSASDLSLITQASQSTYDVIRSSWLPIYIAPYVIDLAIFITIIGFIFSKNLNKKCLFFFTVILVFFGTLVHVENILILSFLVFILIILYGFNIFKSIIHPKTLVSSFIIGLVFAVIIDTVSPFKIDPASISLLQYTILLCISSLVFIVVSQRLQKSFSTTFKRGQFKWRPILPLVILGAYLFLTVAFFFSYSSYTFSEQNVPLWFLPLKAGTAGLLSIAGIFYASRKKSPLDLAIVFFFGVILLELLLYHMPFNFITVDFSEFRIIRDILWIFLSLIGAYGFIRLISIFPKNKQKKKYINYTIIILTIFLLLVSSIPSHLLKGEYFAITQPAISTKEMDALQFLTNLKIPSGSNTLTVLPKSEIYATTGITTLDISDLLYSPLIFNSNSPSTVLWALSYINASCIFLTQTDLSYLSNSYGDTYFTWLLSYLPLIFSNDEVYIYSIPALSPPLQSEDTKVVTGDLLSQPQTIAEDLLWYSDTFNVNWTKSTTVNVENVNFTSNDNIAMISAKTLINQQAAVFYKTNLTNPISTTQDTYATIRVQSVSNVSFAIMDILYSDGTVQRMKVGGSGYINSPTWTTVTNYLEPNKLVYSIQIGITDNKLADGDTISCLFDSIGIGEAGNRTSYYQLPLIASSMQTRYSATTEPDALIGSKVVFISDEQLSDSRMAEYRSWIVGGGTLIAFNINGQAAFSRILGINNVSEVTADSISFGKNTLSLPQTTISKFIVNDSDAVAIANYTSDGIPICPFAFEGSFGQGRLIYIELGSIIQAKSEQNLASIAGFISELLKQYTNIQTFTINNWHRDFYIKNIGDLSIEGEANISLSSMPLGLENIHFTSLTFSNQTINNLKLQNILLSNPGVNNATRPSINIEGNATLTPMDTYNYMNLTFSGVATIEFETSSEQKLKIDFNNGSSQDLTFFNGVLKLTTSNISLAELIIQNPSVKANGDTILNSLFASYPFSLHSNGNQGFVSGELEFNVLLSGKQVSILNNFKVNGSISLKVASSQTSNNDLIFFDKFAEESVFFALAIGFFLLIIYRKYFHKDA